METNEENWKIDFDKMVQEHIQSLPWTSTATEYEKTLVIGNIRHFAQKIKEHIADLPTRLVVDTTKETERVTEERIVKMILDKIKNTIGINTNGISDNVTMVKVFDDGGLRDFVDEKEYINKADLVRFITISFTPIIRNK